MIQRGARRGVLAVDATGERASAAVVVAGRHGHAGVDLEGEAEGRAGAVLHDLAARLLEEAGLSAADLALVVGVRGPGSFTGVRIGLATAAGIAFAAGGRAAGVSTTRAVALASGASGLVTVVLDGGQGRVFAARHVVLEGRVTTVMEPVDAEVADVLALADLGHGVLRGHPPREQDLLAAGFVPFAAPVALAAARLAGSDATPEPLEALYAREPSIRPPAR